MEFLVQYEIDGVGYAKTVTAKDADDAKNTCEAEMKKMYPQCSVTSVEKVEKVEKAKKGKAKDGEKEEEE